MRIIGQEVIAGMFGVAPKTIVEWQEQGFPVAFRGGPGVPSEYESGACIDWLKDREIRKVESERPQDRLIRVQADKIEMENVERRRLLIPSGQLEPKLQAVFAMAREAWSATAPRLARELPADPDERERVLQVEFEAFLHRLADGAKADVEDDDF